MYDNSGQQQPPKGHSLSQYIPTSQPYGRHARAQLLNRKQSSHQRIEPLVLVLCLCVHADSTNSISPLEAKAHSYHAGYVRIDVHNMTVPRAFEPSVAILVDADGCHIRVHRIVRNGFGNSLPLPVVRFRPFADPLKVSVGKRGRKQRLLERHPQSSLAPKRATKTRKQEEGRTWPMGSSTAGSVA